MTSVMLIGGVLLLALLLAAYGYWRRQPPATAGRASADPTQWGAESLSQPDGVGTEAGLPSMQELCRRFFLFSLGGQLPAEGAWIDADPTQRAIVAAATSQLEGTNLSARYMPRRPQLLPQLIQSVNDSAASSRSIAAIIGKDAVLTGNLLRIANSSLYRTQPREVDSLERAVTLVGTQGVREIISAALMQPVMKVHGNDGGRFSQQVWEYALRVSVAAADHARSVEREDAFSAQLMGLLHGLGAVVVVQAALDVYARHREIPVSARVLLELLERHSVPTAARIARSWELSSLVFRSLRDSGQPEQDGQELALQRSLHFGQTAAALAMLEREGQMEEEQALAVLQTQVPAHVAQWTWKRLRNEEEPAVAG